MNTNKISIVSFAATIGLLHLAVAYAIGIPFPIASVATNLIGISCAAGILAFAIADYGKSLSRGTVAGLD